MRVSHLGQEKLLKCNQIQDHVADQKERLLPVKKVLKFVMPKSDFYTDMDYVREETVEVLTILALRRSAMALSNPWKSPVMRRYSATAFGVRSRFASRGVYACKEKHGKLM